MTTQFFDLMCDVECFGKGETAALASIGAVFFCLKIQTMGPTFLRTINLATAVRDGGAMDPSTVLFWLRRRAQRIAGCEVSGGTPVEHLWKIANRNKKAPA